ncbi:peptidyl-tRNA hydrolase II (PTH2) family protein [Artemisia annua]|uniref:peptidyl-tRNA hydrolase n=1 Tax=Artemisia annua TaxID=35608 RepID=A0A2U1MTD9_ARTAN|nr:peptidyl-tRNA hydrolase II (PTH2) family protein [Artemisia annua]
MRFHHGGRFTECPKRKYVDGEVTFVDMVDIDKFKMDLLYSVLNCIGYDDNAITYFHYKIPLKGLDYALRPLSSDNDACKMLKYVPKHKTIYVFVEHDQTTIGTCGNLDNLDIVEEDDHVRQFDEHVDKVDLENDGAELENEGDDLENEDNEIEEVDVPMKGFNFQVDDDGQAEPVNPIVPHVHVDEEAVEEVDFDSLDSDIGDDELSERRKGVRKLKKAAGASGIKNNFFVGKEFPNRDEAKDRIRAYSVECRRNLEFVKNDKERIRVRCIGVVPTINNKDSFLDEDKGCLAMGFFIGTRKLRIKFFITKKLEKAAETVDGSKKGGTKQPLEIEKLAEIIEDFKMVLVVRNDLKMGKGKIAAQCSHATLGLYKKILHRAPKALNRWEMCGQVKVVVKIESEDDMLELQARAKSLNIPTHIVIDAGRTQIAPNSRTVMAVLGPADMVDDVTGGLKLL